MSQDGEVEPSGANTDQEEQEEYQPWYQDRTNPHPFRLVRKITSASPDAPSFRTVAMFPWDVNSLSKLWKGNLNTVEQLAQWKEMISEYWDAVAVGSDYGLYVFFANKKKAPLCVKLPPDTQSLIDTDVMCVAWGLSHNAPFEPLVIFSRGSLLYLYNVARMGICGYIRGHGGPITSISVHPTTAHLFCTTSRDLTTRIYDLTLSAVEPPASQEKQGKKKKEKVPNPVWPPGKTPSLAGAAHGLRLPSSECEGNGAGRCIAVLLGGRSGGHKAAVLGSAFHPEYPLIATCGMDRCVKIWAVRSTSPLEIKREDKPIFTSGRVHKARVLSISWLQDDLLLTHSAPAIMRVSPNDPNNKDTYLEAGELIIWRWLGLDRFFPPGQEDVPPIVLRGCSSDYQESSSFKLISVHAFPSVPSQFEVPKMNLFQSPTHDPLAIFVYPGSKGFCVLNVSHLSPRKPPPFPLEAQKTQAANEGGALASAAERMRLDAQEDDDDANADRPDNPVNNTANGRSEVVPPGIEGWKIGIEDCDGEEMGRNLMNCAIGAGGRLLVGVGSMGSLWVWRYDD